MSLSLFMVANFVSLPDTGDEGTSCCFNLSFSGEEELGFPLQVHSNGDECVSSGVIRTNSL